jgi:outer membrane autotransporter protein
MMVGGRYASRLASENLAASVDTRFIASAAAYQSGRFQGLASVTSAWHDIAAARTVSFPGFADHATSRYASESHRVDLEAAYALSRGKVSISPYAGYSRLMLRSKAFSEDGGISSLSFNDGARSIDQLRVGVRMAGIFRLGSLTFSPHTDVSLNRSSGDIAAVRQAEFISGRQGFDSVGSAFDRRMIALDSGIDVKAGPLKFSGSYRARLGNRWRDQSALLRASLQF